LPHPEYLLILTYIHFDIVKIVDTLTDLVSDGERKKSNDNQDNGQQHHEPDKAGSQPFPTARHWDSSLLSTDSVTHRYNIYPIHELPDMQCLTLCGLL